MRTLNYKMTSDQNNSIMRTVSFVERIEVEFHGNVITQAMVLADVDNDMANELVVGNIDGQVAIFKGDSSQPWKKTSVSGMLTCLAVGEVHLPKKNSLVCMTAEGWCYMYDVHSKVSVHSLGTGEEETDSRVIKPLLSQELPANARVMCLADIDSDGLVEMVIGYSDRVVRAFRWHETPDSDIGQFILMQKWQLAGQIGSITINYNRDLQPELMVSQPGATFVSLQVKPVFRHIKSESCLDKMTGSRPDHSIERSGSFAATGKAELVGQNLLGQSNILNTDVFMSKSDTVSNQSDNISNKSAEITSVRSLDVSIGKSEPKPAKLEFQKTPDSQPQKAQRPKSEGSPARLEDITSKSALKLSLEKLESTKFDSSPLDASDSALDRSYGRQSHILDSSLDLDDVHMPCIIYHPLAHMQTRNKDTSTVIVGGITRGKLSQSSNDSDTLSQATYYALATLDGSLILVENDSIIWSIQVDHYLFALSKLDVTGNGKEEVVCCSWNGQTYIVNHSKEIVRYHFPDSVAAFCAGYFSLEDRINAPCFVYATFNNRIYIYPNITLPRVESTSLMKVMSRKKETKELLRKLNVDENDSESIKDLYHWCLYGQPGIGKS